jgi:TetR/AcrR family transcriptional regulator
MTTIQNHYDDYLNTKNKIFAVAAHLFAEKGFNGVSMREISEHAGISKPTIYYYFGNKEGLYTALVDSGLAHISNNIERIRKLQIPVKEKLVAIMKSNFEECVLHPESVKFFLTLFFALDKPPIMGHFDAEARRPWTTLAEMVQEGIDSGEFGKNAIPTLATEIIGGVLLHLLWHQINEKKPVLSDVLAKDIIELLFRGLNE